MIDDFGSLAGGVVVGVFLPYVIAGIVIGVRTNDWKQAAKRVGGMLKATFGVLKTGIDE